jgi:hypothetical protein
MKVPEPTPFRASRQTKGAAAVTVSDRESVGRARSTAEQAAKAAKPETLSLSLDAMFTKRDERDRHQEADAAEAIRQDQDRRAGDRARFDARGLTDAGREDLLAKITAAFEAGQREVMLVSFPSDFCTDGGRRINNRLPGWQDTLPDGAKVALGFWCDALQLGGFGFGARILNFPGGMLGDVGLFVARPQNRA